MGHVPLATWSGRASLESVSTLSARHYWAALCFEMAASPMMPSLLLRDYCQYRPHRVTSSKCHVHKSQRQKPKPNPTNAIWIQTEENKGKPRIQHYLHVEFLIWYVCKWLVAAAKEISGRYTQITCSYLLLALFMHDNTSKTRQSHTILPDYLQLPNVCMFFFFV